MDPLTVLGSLGLIPVLEVASPEVAADVTEALVGGGLPCAEITFRTPAAEAAIERVATRFPDVCVGAGTVLSTDQVDRAIGAGARYVVSPGFNPVVVERCLERSMPVIPGVCTPTEIEMALSRGIGTVKLFPAEAAGGVGYLRAIRAPYPSVLFVPTGGIDAANLVAYLTQPGVIACGGSWMAPKELIAARDFDAIRRRTAQAVALVAQARSGPRSATA